MEPALHQQRPLEAEGCDEEVETHSAKAVSLKKSHQEAKSNKDHHMDILKTYRAKTEEERDEETYCLQKDFGDMINTKKLFSHSHCYVFISSI